MTRDYIFDFKEKKDTQSLKNWRPVSLLNVDYKIATKTIALRIEKVLHTFDQSFSNRLYKRKVHRRKHQLDYIMEYTKH